MQLKKLIWIGSSKKDLEKLPEEIIDEIGYSLYIVQIGEYPSNAKVFKGFGNAGTLEIKNNQFRGNI